MHEGHRTRLRNKFLKYGAEGLEKHELLELYLTYSIPRRNTNDIAHNLINKFVTMDLLFEAESDNIFDTKGVGYNSVLIIKLLGKLYNIDNNLNMILYKISSLKEAYRYLERNSPEYPNGTLFYLQINHRMEITAIDVLGLDSKSLARPISDILRDFVNLETKYIMIAEKIEDTCKKFSLDDNYIKKWDYYCTLMYIKILGILVLIGNKCKYLINNN